MNAARFILIPALLAAVACGDKVEGALYIDTDSYRTLEFAPGFCTDGDHYGFFGVQLLDDEDMILDFFRNGDAPGIALYPPGDAAFELGPADCTILEGALHRDRNETTGAGRVHGNLELDCEAPNGWTLRGALSFERCEDPVAEDECDDDDDDDGDEHEHDDD